MSIYGQNDRVGPGQHVTSRHWPHWPGHTETIITNILNDLSLISNLIIQLANFNFIPQANGVKHWVGS